MGILFDNQLKFHQHTSNIAAKANHLLWLIKRSFDHLDSDILTKSFVSIVRPTLEYCNAVWVPSFILDHRKIEQVQHRATKLLTPISDKPYEERLLILELPSLTLRHHRGDMILLYKVLNNYFNSDLFLLYILTPPPPLGIIVTNCLSFVLCRLNCRTNYFLTD